MCLAQNQLKQEAFAARTPQPFSSGAAALGGAEADPSRAWVLGVSQLPAGWL